MAGFIQETKIQAAFKKLAGRALTKAKADEGFKEEALPSNVTVAGGTVFAEELPSVPDRTPVATAGTAGAITGGSVESVQLVLTPIPGTSYNSGLAQDTAGTHGYQASLPVGYEANSNNPKVGTIFLDGAILANSEGKLQCIPPIFGVNGGVADTNLYGAVLRDTGGNIIAGNDSREWYFDYYNGVLFQERASNDANGDPLPTPGSIEILLYIGDFVTDIIGTGTGTSTGEDSDWNELGEHTYPGIAGATGTFLVTTSSVAINPFGGPGFRAFDAGADTSFYVYGEPGSRAEWLQGTPDGPGTVAQFGGDLTASGSLVAGNDGMGGLFPWEIDWSSAHIFTGSHIDIGSGWIDDGNDVAIRQIGNLGSYLWFKSTSMVTTVSGPSSYTFHHPHGIEIKGADGPLMNNPRAGNVWISAGDHSGIAAPDFENPPPPGVTGGGDIIIKSGDGNWSGGDIVIFAGGTSGTGPELDGSRGGDIQIYAGPGRRSGNVAIAGGWCAVNSGDNDLLGDQVNTGDVYIDGGSDPFTNEAQHKGNVLINTVRFPGQNYDPAPAGTHFEGETWQNIYHPELDITAAMTLVYGVNTGNSFKLIASEKMIHILCGTLGVNGCRKITARDYQNSIPATNPPHIWQGPFAVTLASESLAAPAGLPSAFEIKWGLDTSFLPTQQYHLKITIYATGGNTVQDLAIALEDPNSWFTHTGVSWAANPVGNIDLNPIRLEFNPADVGVAINNPGTVTSTFVDDMVCESKLTGIIDLALDDSTERGMGIGEPVPTATLHVTDNGRANKVREADGGVGIIGTPIAIDGLNVFTGYGSLLIATPDPYDANFPDSKTDLVYKLPLQTFSSFAAAAASAGGARRSTTKLNTTLASSGHLSNSRYVIDAYDGGPAFTQQFATGTSGAAMAAPAVWFDETIMIDTNDNDVQQQAAANNNKIEIELPSSKYPIYVMDTGEVKKHGDPTIDSTKVIDVISPEGREIIFKDMGGLGDVYHIELLPAWDDALQEFEKIDDLGGSSGIVCNMSSPFSCLKIVANGDGWSIIG